MSKNVKIALGVLVGVLIVVGVIYSQGQLNTGAIKNLFMMGKGGEKGGAPASPPFTGPQNACTSPYHVRTADGRCVWSCGAGTHPNGASNICDCNGGVSFTGFDRFGRQVCGVPPFSQPFTGPQNACTSPYHVRTADGRCVWSCGEGTQPDVASNQCVCQGGLVEVAVKDVQGRRRCLTVAAPR